MALVRLHYWVLVRWPSLLRPLHRLWVHLVNRENRGLYAYIDATVTLTQGQGQCGRLCALPPRPPRCMRIVMISDTHCGHRDICVPDGDMLIHAGDWIVWVAFFICIFFDHILWLLGLMNHVKPFTIKKCFNSLENINFPKIRLLR